ncbi:hypothetical protein M5D96_000762 [Drosophila gunungcola]|uniref:Zinc finger protein Xfin n=1 Tax=Drosophila gunungcola TaxID=103775 RepID=A0A9P9YWW3_9MUSC|nr:hypothetical protein M5D96_000762 [Drosophila gunungcola]
MLPTDICRTCALQNSNLLPLSTCLARDATKSLYAVLQELTQIDPQRESADDNLPQHLCTDCWTRLEDAYAFVEQAREVNGELTARLRECLDEMPIDIPQEQSIKTEVDLDDGGNKSEGQSVKPTEPSPIKRRRGRPPGSAKSQSKTTDGRHACEVCGKTFSWYRDMQRHARMHFEQASFGFLRKDKYTFHLRCHKKREAKWKALQLGNEWRFAERLYSSGSLKRVECKLCGLKCTHIEELRSHLKSHVDLETLDSDVVREHFPGLPCDLDIIKQQISADIAEGQTEKFACVVNFHGYELGLSDSDDESASLDSIYNCSVCNLPFNRKHRLTSTALPWQRCSFCKIGFLCSTLYNQHLSSHCHSKIKRYRCRKCPGKFMWPENLQRHACSHRREGTMPRHISCSLCDSPLANCSAADLAARIAEDFEVQDFDRYYNACTESGQELDLFDSESEESDETSKLSHTCLLCGETSSTLTILMQHQKKVHSTLLQQHRRRSCGQKHSRFYCQACNLRFVWQANYEQHLRTHHDTVKKYDEETMAAKQVYCATKLQCDECDKVFIWHKDLTRHKRLHQPQSAAQFDCPHCHRKFHRKDGLKSHLKVHPGAPENLKEEPATAHVAPGQGMALSRLSRPHGCKLIQDTASASRSFYPELEIVLEREKLAGKIMADVERDLELDRFVSITNEAGLELNLDSSETDSESEQEQDISEKCYACNLCSTVLFAHQLEQHEMEETCLVCSHCQVRFVNESLLDHHSRTLCYNPQKVFQCRKCPLRFRWRENLKLHTSLCHQQGEIPIPDESSQACGECHRSFKMQKDLTRHTLMHAQESNIFRCRWCARRFYRWANLLQHIARHGISVECRVCSLSFPTIAALRLHLETMPAGSHHELSSLQNYSITNQMGFEMELDDSETDEEDGRTHSKPPGVPDFYTCGMCLFKSVCPEIIVHHRKTQCENREKQFTCTRCGYKFMWESNLLQHMQLQHEKQEDQELDESKEASGDEPKAEVGQFHGPDGKGSNPVKVSNRATSPKEPKRFLCAFCGKAVSSSSNLIIHMRRHTGEKPFKCEYCTMAFPRSSDLQCHRRTHTGERPHHMRIHSGERPYKCTYCEKSFTQSNDLTLHIRRHTGERPYQCGVCGERFIQGTALKNHRMQQNHYEEGQESGETPRRTVLEHFADIKSPNTKMVKRFKASSSLGASDGGSVRSGNCKDSDQVYCVLLHVVEAINFVSRDGSEREQIVMNAALNTVDFEVEGTQSAETIIFNSNCIWECDLAGIKRIKTDHRPVKITFSACRGGLPVLATTGSHNGANLKMFWHKLICISSEFRSHKPEVLLMLAIIKKSILHTKDFDHLMQFTEQKTPPTPPLQSPGHSITASMLQSQANVYVQSLVQLGLLQVGNDPLIDCDIIEVVLQLKQLKNVNRLVKTLDEGKGTGSVILVFDFVGNVTNIELKLNESDSYILNDTSLRSMRLYFQRIFYLPINMYMNGSAIATYRMDFGNLLPPDNYFSEKRKYTHNGSFSFNRLAKRDSAREPKSPLMEYSFSVDVKTLLSGQGQEEPESTSSVASGVIRDHDTASVASLNVGAELSVSEGSCRSTSPKEDGPDSDASVDHRKPENRRKKFTRLQCEEDSGESEDELRLGKTFSALVVQLEDFEEMSTSTQETRSSKTSKGNLGLRARWVEVNKKQTQVLDETEKFLQETCRAELDEVLYEDQLAFGLAKPLKLKKKEIAICQSQEDLVKKKKRTMPIHQMEIESSEEYISLSEGILRSAEMIYSETEHRDVRVTFAQPKGGRVKKKMRADEDDMDCATSSVGAIHQSGAFTGSPESTARLKSFMM